MTTGVGCRLPALVNDLHESGRVEITVRMAETGKVVFSVTDDGIGLAIVKHILEAHGSRLTINSKIGRGSTFSFGLDSTPLHHTQPNDK